MPLPSSPTNGFCLQWPLAAKLLTGFERFEGAKILGPIQISSTTMATAVEFQTVHFAIRGAKLFFSVCVFVYGYPSRF